MIFMVFIMRKLIITFIATAMLAFSASAEDVSPMDDPEHYMKIMQEQIKKLNPEQMEEILNNLKKENPIFEDLSIDELKKTVDEIINADYD